MKMWRMFFFFCGGIVLVLFICWKCFQEARSIAPEREFSYSGLGGLLSRCRTKRNVSIAAMLAPFLFLICLRFTRGYISFLICLAVLTEGLLVISILLRRRHKVTDFRELGRNLVAGGAEAGGPAFLETLDGEVRRGEVIAYASHAYYLYPSALIAERSDFSSAPNIIPVKDIKSVSHKITSHAARHHGQPSSFDMFRVSVYGKTREKLGEAACHKNSDAEFLIKTLNQRFGVADLGMTPGKG